MRDPLSTTSVPIEHPGSDNVLAKVSLLRGCLEAPAGVPSLEAPDQGSPCLEGACQPLSPQQGPSQTRQSHCTLQSHCSHAVGSAISCEVEQARAEGWAAAQEVVPEAEQVTRGRRGRVPGGCHSSGDHCPLWKELLGTE